MMSVSLFLVLLLLHRSSSVNYSIPAIQKCEGNKLPDGQTEISVPGGYLFRLVERCATRLPHCLEGCEGPMTSVSVRAEEPESYSDLDVSFTHKGYLKVDEHYYGPDEYCVQSERSVHADGGEELVLRICPSSCGSGSSRVEVCVPKCCSLHKVLNPERDSCEEIESGVQWAPIVYRSASRRVCGEKLANLKLHYSQKTPDCDSFTKYFLKNVYGETRVRFRLLTNTSLLLREIGHEQWTVLQDGVFCLDGVQVDGQPYSGGTLDQVLLVCERNLSGNGSLGSGAEQRLTWSGIAYTALLFAGVPPLLVTVVIYLLVWGKQNVHGWTLFSHSLAVLLHYLAQGVANVVSRVYTSEMSASGVCWVVGVLNHVCLFAMFGWMTVINYDLFSMFRHLKTTVGRRGVKRFAVYSLIAWGVPLLVVAVSVVLDLKYGLYGEDGDCELELVVPLYGHKSCYMVADARPYYLYYPVGILMAVNLVLGGMTACSMWRHDQESRNAHGEFKRNTKHRRKFSVLAKLFAVCGIVFVFEVFVWSFIKEGEVLPWYLVFPDVLNVLQAFAIFILFACQPKILRQVEEAYPRLSLFTGCLQKLSCGGGGKESGGTSAVVGSAAKA